MSDFDNTNRGAIWPNKNRENDRQPHFTGSLNVDGVEYWVSAWKKKPDASERAPSLSFAITIKDDADQRANRPAPESFDEDIPF